MCLIVSGKGNKFIAKKNIIVYKQLEGGSFCGYVTSHQNFPVKLNSEIVPKGKIELRSYGSKQCLDRGAIHAYAIIPRPGIYFKAIIKKGTEFWIQDDLTQIAAEKLYLTDKKAFYKHSKPTDFSDYLKEGVDVYLKDGRRCKITDSFDKKDVIGVYGYDNQVIALEYKYSRFFNEELPNEISKNNFIEENSCNRRELITKLEKDLDGYGNTKQLKDLGIKSDALDYCESLGKNWYIPSSGELKKVFKNQLRINITLQYLGIPQIDFRWFWSSTLGSSQYTWDYCGDGGDWCYDGFDCFNVRYYRSVLPFLELS